MKTRLLTFITVTALFSFIGSSQAADREDRERPVRPSFASLDLDSDGKVVYDEFLSHEVPMGDHKTIFENIDADNDGEISEKEFTNHKPPRRNEHKGPKRD
ncbi:EF-hand domain-containing protein [Paraglaciecola sp. L3A3]|uniref:EF-hand domain-containing protein n=1 Tax=Paraglaciecola sp. L3A3 TaxID=2686358 RepID=UPI00131DA6E4|nr:EF-hand domain-containing protein [Paraglaciecola sp. L3A3]